VVVITVITINHVHLLDLLCMDGHHDLNVTRILLPWKVQFWFIAVCFEGYEELHTLP